MAARPRIPIRKTYAFMGDGETELQGGDEDVCL